MVNLVAVDDKVGDGCFGIRTVNRNAKPVAAPARSVPPRKGLLDMVDIVVQELNVSAGALYTDADGSAHSIVRTVIPDLEALNSNVALIRNKEHGASSFGSEVLPVQNSCLAWRTPKGNVSIACIAGHVDGDPLLIRPSSHIHRASRGSRIGGMLNRSPGRLHGAWIRIVTCR